MNAGLSVEQVQKTFRSNVGERVADRDRATQLFDIGNGVGPLNTNRPGGASILNCAISEALIAHPRLP
jgi:hypothetical protein